MNTRFLVALVPLVACSEPPTPPVIAPVQSAPAAPSTPAPPPASPPPVASTSPSTSPSSSAAPAASASVAEPAPASAPPVGPSCKTVNDCWIDDDRKPIARPAKFRGKVIRPCKDSEHAPACSDGVCIVRHFKC